MPLRGEHTILHDVQPGLQTSSSLMGHPPGVSTRTPTPRVAALGVKGKGPLQELQLWAIWSSEAEERPRDQAGADRQTVEGEKGTLPPSPASSGVPGEHNCKAWGFIFAFFSISHHFYQHWFSGLTKNQYQKLPKAEPATLHSNGRSLEYRDLLSCSAGHPGVRPC